MQSLVLQLPSTLLRYGLCALASHAAFWAAHLTSCGMWQVPLPPGADPFLWLLSRFVPPLNRLYSANPALTAGGLLPEGEADLAAMLEEGWGGAGCCRGQLDPVMARQLRTLPPGGLALSGVGRLDAR